jgi:hypothetical protein
MMMRADCEGSNAISNVVVVVVVVGVLVQSFLCLFLTSINREY